jgi:hypothetical protein
MVATGYDHHGTAPLLTQCCVLARLVDLGAWAVFRGVDPRYTCHVVTVFAILLVCAIFTFLITSVIERRTQNGQN